jgi:hypothetical protein
VVVRAAQEILMFMVAMLVSLATAPLQEQRIIGLVEIPALFGVLESDQPVPTPPDSVRPISLRDSPDPAATIVVSIESADAIEVREHGYEQPSAVVYEISKNGWYLLSYTLGARSGKAWLDPADAGVFRDVATLLRDGLSYLTREWDRKLYAAPAGEPAAHQIPSDMIEPAIIIADHTVQNDEDWFLVVVQSSSPCEGMTHPPVVSAGWLPAHTRSGQMQLWFHARGC